jgi:acetamidase/formamidase
VGRSNPAGRGRRLTPCRPRIAWTPASSTTSGSGLSREEAYVLASVGVDLRISEIVDAPNWIVSAFLPEGIFT